MGVVAVAAGWVLWRLCVAAVYTCLFLFMAGGTDTGLLLREQNWVLVAVNVMAGDAGQVVMHVQGVLPVGGAVVFVAIEAGAILCRAVALPAGTEGIGGGDLSRRVGVGCAGAVTILAAAGKPRFLADAVGAQ
jgi:hypothetical protein